MINEIYNNVQITDSLNETNLNSFLRKSTKKSSMKSNNEGDLTDRMLSNTN